MAANDGDNQSYPASLELLQNKAGVKLTSTDRNDPDNVGFVQWRSRFVLVCMRGV